VQIGILLGLPFMVSAVIEPFMGILGDIGWRRRIMLIGGVAAMCEAVVFAFGTSYEMLLLTLCITFPLSGPFVTLAQATLMDVDPKRHEQNMARWTLFGAVGVFIAPLLLAATGGNWRGLFLVMAVLIGLATLLLSRFPIQESSHPDVTDMQSGIRAALRDLGRFVVLRWLVLLRFADLMGDVLYGYLALYMVDVAGVDTGTALVAVAVWTGVGLVGDVLIIPLLERVRGLVYLRASAAVNLVLFPAFLLVPGVLPKIVLLALLGVFNAGWYSVLQGRLYSSMPGRSGSVTTLDSLFGLVGGALPFIVGATADAFGLGAAIWLLLLGPVALLVGLPRGEEAGEEIPEEELS
jgi:FSR family fosmidomycin resistance protein-like MFS transporter